MSSATTPTAQANAGKDVCAAKKWFGSKSEPPCKVCDACKNEQKEQCTLYPGYEPNCCGKQNPSKTPHHLVPVHCFMESGERKAAEAGGRLPKTYGGVTYDPACAPCICVDKGRQKVGTHKKIHDKFDPIENSHKVDGKAGVWTYEQARDAAAKCAKEVDEFQCDEGCIKAQLDEYHLEQCKMKPTQPLRADAAGQSGSPAGIPAAASQITAPVEDA